MAIAFHEGKFSTKNPSTLSTNQFILFHLWHNVRDHRTLEDAHRAAFSGTCAGVLLAIFLAPFRSELVCAGRTPERWTNLCQNIPSLRAWITMGIWMGSVTTSHATITGKKMRKAIIHLLWYHA